MPDLMVNGHKHHYEDVGEGIPMVFIAGTRFDAARLWVDYMREHATGFRMIMPDLRGMADSEHVTDIEPADWVRDLGGFLDQIGIDSIHLAAETLGTRVVTRFAYEHPTRVKSLVLNGAITYSYAEGDEDRVRQADPANITAEARERLEYYHGPEALKVNRFYIDTHAKPEFHQYYDLRAIAESVQTPALIIRGDIDDDRHPVSHSAILHELMPDSRLQIFANTGFNGMVRKPAESWALIRELAAE